MGAHLLGASVVIVGDLARTGSPRPAASAAPGDPGGVDEAARVGALSLSFGTGWAKSLSFITGQCPVMKDDNALMEAILTDKVQIAKAVSATVISPDDAPRGYAEFDGGAAQEFVIDPHGAPG